jgi:hypothetical protein
MNIKKLEVNKLMNKNYLNIYVESVVKKHS